MQLEGGNQTECGSLAELKRQGFEKRASATVGILGKLPEGRKLQS